MGAKGDTAQNEWASRQEIVESAMRTLLQPRVTSASPEVIEECLDFDIQRPLACVLTQSGTISGRLLALCQHRSMKEQQMPGRAESVLEERRRLGSWLPRKEAELIAFRKDLAPRTSAVEELAMLIDGDPVLRMDLTRAITDAVEAGYELGYSSSDELMDILNYLMTYAPRFSEASLIHCPLNAVLDWPMCMPSGYALFRDPVVNANAIWHSSLWVEACTKPS